LNRSKIAVIGLLAVAVLTVLNFLLDLPAVQLPDITRFDTHVARVRTAIPPTGMIGYYTDYVDPPGASDALREFYLVQYALVPVVVDKSVNQKLVITSLHRPQDPIRNPNLELVREYGSGVRLLRNRTK